MAVDLRGPESVVVTEAMQARVAVVLVVSALAEARRLALEGVNWV